MVAWVLLVGEYAPMTGQIVGVKEWPDGGRVLDQPAAVVEAVEIVLGELQEMRTPKGKEESSGTPGT